MSRKYSTLSVPKNQIFVMVLQKITDLLKYFFLVTKMYLSSTENHLSKYFYLICLFVSILYGNQLILRYH